MKTLLMLHLCLFIKSVCLAGFEYQNTFTPTPLPDPWSQRENLRKLDDLQQKVNDLENDSIRNQRKLSHREVMRIMQPSNPVYQDPLSKEDTISLALQWAADGSAHAQLFLGHSYNSGDGVVKDPSKAAMWYQKAAEQGNRDAQFFLAKKYDSGDGVARDPAKAARWYRKAADQGDPDAQFWLAIKYTAGYGVVEDQAEAVKWFRKAADQGVRSAQLHLGQMLLYGTGVKSDFAAANYFLHKASTRGSAAAQYHLGIIHYMGYGVSKDYIQAHAWFNISAAHGDKKSQGMRSELEKKMTLEQITYAKKLANTIMASIEAE